MRRDVGIVANDLLTTIAPRVPLMLAVRIRGGRPTPASIAAMESALRAEACVVSFPADEVSRPGPRSVRDTRWRRGLLRFVRNTGAPVLPVRIETRNSPLFHGVSAEAPDGRLRLLSHQGDVLATLPAQPHGCRSNRCRTRPEPGRRVIADC